MGDGLLDPFQMVEIFRDDLETVLPHPVLGKVEPGYPLHPKQGLDLFRTLLANAVVLERYDFKTSHLYDPPEKLPQSVLIEVLPLTHTILSL